MKHKALFVCIIFLLIFLTISSTFAKPNRFRLDGHLVVTDKVEEKTPGQFYLTQPVLKFSSFMGSGQLSFPYIILDQQQKVIECAVGTDQVNILQFGGGLSLDTTSYQFIPEGFFLSGVLHLPTIFKIPADIEFSDREIQINKDGFFIIEKKMESVYNLFGFDALVQKISSNYVIDQDNVSTFSLSDVTLSLPEQGNFVHFDLLHFYADGYIMKPENGKILSTILVKGGLITLVSCKIVSDQIQCTGYRIVNQDESEYIEFVLHSDGVIE